MKTYKFMPTNPEEEELKRQREIRHLPYSEVSYLVSEILAFLQQKIENIKPFDGFEIEEKMAFNDAKDLILDLSPKK